MVVLFVALALELIFRKRKKSDFSHFIRKKTKVQKKSPFVLLVFMQIFYLFFWFSEKEDVKSSFNFLIILIFILFKILVEASCLNLASYYTDQR